MSRGLNLSLGSDSLNSASGIVKYPWKQEENFKIRFTFIKKTFKNLEKSLFRKLNCPDKEYTGCLNTLKNKYIESPKIQQVLSINVNESYLSNV